MLTLENFNKAGVGQVRMAVEQMLSLEFDTEEQLEAAIDDYAQQMCTLEQEEESLINSRIENFYVEARGGIQQDLHEFVPWFMDDLCKGNICTYIYIYIHIPYKRARCEFKVPLVISKRIFGNLTENFFIK